jgi:N-glycosylase/DNA lyase
VETGLQITVVQRINRKKWSTNLDLMDFNACMSDDDEYTWATFSPNGSYNDHTQKYIVKEALANFLNLSVNSRHTIEAIATRVLEHVETHEGLYKEGNITYYKFDKELWEALEKPNDAKIKDYHLHGIISTLVDYPTPFEFEARMKTDIWKCS